MRKKSLGLNIPQIEPNLGVEEKMELMKVIDSGWISPGPKTKEFEEKVRSLIRVKYAICVPNGTLAITLACKVLGINFGDEVIMPDLTMAGTANGVILAGGVPVFVDINPSDLNIDPDQVEKKITKKTKAIIPVHFNGRPCEMNLLKKIARRKNLVIIEDAAHALGSKYQNKYLGTIGDVGCLSFSVPKIVTTGQGGMAVTNRKAIYEKLIKLRDQGRRKPGADIHDSVGFNFRFTDMQAAVGIAQMKKIRKSLIRKKEIYLLYQRLLAHVSQVRFIETNLNLTAPWFIDVLAEDRKKLIIFLRNSGIGVREIYPPMHKHGAFRNFTKREDKFPNTEKMARLGLWLPSSVTLKDSQVERVCRLIRKFYRQ